MSASVEERERIARGWLLLIRAHDHILRRREIPLRDRKDTCDLMHRLSIEVLR